MSASICSTPDCGRPSRPNRVLCWCCHKRRYRAAHPIRDAWHALRHHANLRRIAVGISFAEFEWFCLRTGYHQKRGNEADSLTIDRFDAEIGYEATNINILPRSENSRKWWEIDRPRRLANAWRQAA